MSETLRNFEMCYRAEINMAEISNLWSM